MNKQVETVIDKYISKWEDIGLNLFITSQYQDMISGSNEFGTTWKPIESTVTDRQLIELEKSIGYDLPVSFKDFLKYKHFIELHIGEVEFFSHPSSDWQKHILEPIFDGYPTDCLIEKGLMPFANYSDWGHVCFNLTNMINNESAVYLWDHERANEVELVYPSFESMILTIDKKLEAENNET